MTRVEFLSKNRIRMEARGSEDRPRGFGFVHRRIGAEFRAHFGLGRRFDRLHDDVYPSAHLLHETGRLQRTNVATDVTSLKLNISAG